MHTITVPRPPGSALLSSLLPAALPPPSRAALLRCVLQGSFGARRGRCGGETGARRQKRQHGPLDGLYSVGLVEWVVCDVCAAAQEGREAGGARGSRGVAQTATAERGWPVLCIARRVTMNSQSMSNEGESSRRGMIHVIGPVRRSRLPPLQAGSLRAAAPRRLPRRPGLRAAAAGGSLAARPRGAPVGADTETEDSRQQHTEKAQLS